jgi:hypothetical protein
LGHAAGVVNDDYDIGLGVAEALIDMAITVVV